MATVNVYDIENLMTYLAHNAREQNTATLTVYPDDRQIIVSVTNANNYRDNAQVIIPMTVNPLTGNFLVNDCDVDLTGNVAIPKLWYFGICDDLARKCQNIIDNLSRVMPRERIDSIIPSSGIVCDLCLKSQLEHLLERLEILEGEYKASQK